jgi:hypothetical protein
VNLQNLEIQETNGEFLNDVAVWCVVVSFVLEEKKVDGGLVHGLSWSLTVSPPTMSCDYCDCRLNESFLQLDGAKVRDQVERTWANSYKASKKFLKEYPEMSKVALTLREETTEFKTLVPIIEALGNKAMKDRHWQVLAEETGTCG